VRRVRVIDSAERFPQIKGLWEETASYAVQPKAAALTVFQSYAWNEIAARVFAKWERPYVVVAESDSGAAIIPACVRGDFVSLLGEELFDYRDVIVCGDEALLDRAWRKVADLALPVEIKAVRGERTWAEMRSFAGAPYLPASVTMKRNKSLERNLRLLAEQRCALGTQGLKPVSFKGDHHPAKAGCSPGSALDRAKSGQRRSDRLAALAEALPLDCASPAATAPLGVTTGMGRPQSMLPMQVPRHCAPRNDKSDLSGFVRRMYELKARHESGSLFRDPLRIDAVVEMAASAPSEVFTIQKEGELVAAALTFIDGNVCRFYGTYYDERWARYSPGVSLLYRVIEQAQARGLDFDFMTGEQPYKMRFATEVVPLYIAQVPAAGRIAA
jgi:Acetyltransferase (GNAT) domain